MTPPADRAPAARTHSAHGFFTSLKNRAWWSYGSISSFQKRMNWRSVTTPSSLSPAPSRGSPWAGGRGDSTVPSLATSSLATPRAHVTVLFNHHDGRHAPPRTVSA